MKIRDILLILFITIIGNDFNVYAIRGQSDFIPATIDTFVDPNNPDANYDAQRLELTYSNFPDFVATRQASA